MTNKEKSKIQKEIVDSLDINPVGRLLLAPRVGKTKIAIDIIKVNKPNSILWVTPSAELAKKDIPKEFETWKAKKYISKLTTSTWKSLDKIKGHFDMIILDEEQCITENNAQNLLNNELTYTSLISMTGTPTKHKSKHNIYKKISLSVLYDMSINEAVDIGLLSNYSIKVLEVDMSTVKNIEAGSKENKFKTSEELQYKWLHNTARKAVFQKRKDAPFRLLSRMRAIYNSNSKYEAAEYLMKNLQGRKLFFCASIEQAEKLCNNTYHSETDNEDLKKFQSGEIDNITMVNTGGTGFTYKAIDNLVLVQADSDKNGLTSQKLCRTLLAQKDYKATIWIVCLTRTQDEAWVKSTLENFDKEKIEYIRFKNLVNKKDFSNSEDSLSMFRKHGVKQIQSGSNTYNLD